MLSLVEDNPSMVYEIKTTLAFNKWLKTIKDPVSRARIMARLQRIRNGNLGMINTIDNRISEFKFTFGGGIRIYYTIVDKQIILLLTGGNKSTQKKDIIKARQILIQTEK